MNPGYIEVKACSICGNQIFTKIATRIDGVSIIKCSNCQMGTVEHYPHDLSVLYGEDYYSDAIDSPDRGYKDYEAIASHSLSWIAHFLQLLRPQGRVLDVGCANGYLLKLLGDEYTRYGIEVNSLMIEECQSAGITIVGRDVTDSAMSAQYRQAFDIVTGIAVLEHVSDLKAALRNIKEMMTTDGVFIFEVPLMSDTHDNAVWLKSSLEHVYYPTITGLRYIFSEVFDLPLIGHECSIRDYGSVFFGIATRSMQKHADLERLHRHLFLEPVTELASQKERVVRFLFDVVHSAQTTQTTITLLKDLPPPILTPQLLTRLSQIWHRDIWQRDTVTVHAEVIEELISRQRENDQIEIENWRRIADERARWIALVEEARDYHAQQSQSWQAATQQAQEALRAMQEQYTALVRERDILLSEGAVAHLRRQLSNRRVQRMYRRKEP